MKIVYVTTMGASVRRRGDRLQVWKGDEKIEDLRLFDLDRLVLVGPVQLTAQAIGLLLERGVDVSFLSAGGRLKGSLVSAESRNVFLRLAHYDRWKDQRFRLDLSRQLVTAKLSAQQRVLARYQRNHPDRIAPGAITEIERLIGELEKMSTVDEVRGVEGAGASAYYQQFGRMLTTVGFPGRKKHPSTDPANALLSLGYVMVGNEVGSLLEAQGFDPAIGFLHGVRYGRKSLALDLVEIFRQPVVDRLTVRLLNLGQFTPEHFEGGPKGLRLIPDSFKRYLELYEEHLRSPSEGAESPTWRDRLREQVAELRKMVMDGKVRPLYQWPG